MKHLANERCAHCGEQIQTIYARKYGAPWPRWIHRDGRMHCFAGVPSPVAEPRRAERVA